MRYLILAFALAACTPNPIPSSDKPPRTESAIDTATGIVLPAMPKLEAGCPKPGTVQAVDLSMPVDQKFLTVAKALGVKTIIRYGDYVNETIRGKTPKPAERALIQANGMAEMFVFQHNNSKLPSFTAARGRADAERMAQLYPEVPAWYYGVDLDVYREADLAKVDEYAAHFKSVAAKHRKDVGVYGSGTVIQRLQKKGMVKYGWLSMSTGFSGTKAFTATNKWHMRQLKDTKCGGKEADFNIVNIADFGQYRK